MQWMPENGIEKLWNTIRTVQTFAKEEQVKEEMSDMTVIRITLQMFETNHVFTPYQYNQWTMKSDETHICQLENTFYNHQQRREHKQKVTTIQAEYSRANLTI